MSNTKLTEQEIERLTQHLRENGTLPAAYKEVLFPPEKKAKEYRLEYDGKEREEDILADTWSAPFQPIKTFGNPKPDEWVNKLIFGDNLQALKYLLKDLTVAGKVKLVYIDPPFATKQEFQGARGERAYSDKVAGSEFLEFLRMRFIMIRELLASDGTLFVHLDYRFSHYAKNILDEVFGVENFRNEIVWQRTTNTGSSKSIANKLSNDTDSILYYGRTGNIVFNKLYREYGETYLGRFKYKDNRDYYRWSALKTYSQETYDRLKKEGRIRWGKKAKYPEVKQYKGELKGVPLNNLWDDIFHVNPMALEKVEYVTQKPEELLERIIRIASNENDLILDCFAGSGTTLAVAEKLGRRWIGIDSSKYAVYTMQKRLLNLKSEIGNKGKPLKHKSFVLYNAGLYDYKLVEELGEEEYKRFSAELFQVERKETTLNGLRLDGTLNNAPVKIFEKDKDLTEDYIEYLHKTVGKLVKKKLYIIAPSNRVAFLEDTIRRNGTEYTVLRIPYSIVEELHQRKQFARLKQPTSEMDINQIADSVGFDFVYPPKVEADYFVDKVGLFDALCIHIKKFEAMQVAKKPVEFKDREALAAVFVDRDYNGSVFNLTDSFFADHIAKDDYCVRISFEKDFGEKLMIIYLDALGNELKEVKELKDFGYRKKNGKLPINKPKRKVKRIKKTRRAK